LVALWLAFSRSGAQSLYGSKSQARFGICLVSMSAKKLVLLLRLPYSPMITGILE